MLPFMMLHWLCNNNACFLTLMEKKIRRVIYGKLNEGECITCKIFEPIYDFNKKNKKYSKLLYLITTFLVSLSIYKIYNKYKIGEIVSYKDLFII